MGVRPSKRAGSLVRAGALLVAILVLGCAAVQARPFPRPDDSGTDPDLSPGRDSVSYDDKLYFHNNGTSGAPYMNTTAGTNSVTRNLPVEVSLESPLGADVNIVGKDTNSGGKGMWVYFTLTGPTQINQITIEIKQNNETIARVTTPNLLGQNRWDVPFVSGTNHTFPMGSVIRVSVSSSMPTLISLGGSGSYLLMPLQEPPISVAVSTYYAAGKPANEFQPNGPDEIRHIRVEGDITSLFGPSDVRAVLVTIRNPSGEGVSNGSAQLMGTHYMAQWNYSKGQVPGNYNITVKASDRQAHDYFAYTVVTMLRYAVFISSPQADTDGVLHGGASPPKGGSTPRDAVYTLRIMNTGYSPTGVSVRVSSNPPPGWTASLNPTSFNSINAGSYESCTLTISASEEVDFGDKAVIYVEAIADSDPRTPKATWTIQSVTNATMSRNFEFTILGPSENWVDVGQTATYQLQLRNKGILDMNVTLSVSGTPVGWSHTIDVNTKIYLDTGSSSDKQVNLRVTAPSEEVANLSRIAQITITAQVVEEPTMEKTITTVTRLITILSLTVSPPKATSDSSILGGKVDFRTTIANVDPLNAHDVRIIVTQPGDWPSSSVKYDPKQTLLSPNGTTTITISITPPSTTEANEITGYTVGIRIEPVDQPTRSNSTAVTVLVKQRYEISLSASASSLEVKPGKTSSLTLTVNNEGNGNDSVIIFVSANIPQDWKVKLNDVLSPQSLTLQLAGKGRTGSMATINLTIQPSDGSKDGDKVNVTITAKSPHTVNEKSVKISTTVTKELFPKIWDAVWDSALLILLTIFVLVIFAVVRRRSMRSA